MIRFYALGIRFSLPLLTLVFPILASQLGLDGGTSSLLLALGMHELAHVLAARWVGVEIREIRLLPFGGSARMENPYGVPAHRMLIVAAAGPAMNLLLAVTSSALVHWRWLPAEAVSPFVRHNLVLCLFNLLPALPLDGGRIAYALLQRRFGEVFPLKLALGFGGVLAAALMILTVWGGLQHGKWNLSFLLAALFVLSSQQNERSALYLSRAQQLCQTQHAGKILPVRFYRAGRDVDVRAALNLLRPREKAYFLLPDGVISEDDLLAHIIQNDAADTPLCGLNLPGHKAHTAAPKF